MKTEFIRQYQSVMAPPPLARRITDRCRPECCLAQKDSGSVWLMEGADGGRYILKLDDARRKTLGREYALMGQMPEDLPCPVPRAVDYFEQDGTACLLRTYLPGRPLSQAWGADTPCPEEECVRIGVRLCALLDRLHGLDPPVIHRDIKPENIILTPEGEPALIDFGIARNYRDGQGADTVFMGTRRTAAPEQYGYAQTDQRTDLYALGVTLIWLLTGSYEPGALEEIPCSRRLKRCLQKAAAFDPSDRYASAREMGRALSSAAGGGKPAVRAALLGGLALVLGGGLLCLGPGILSQDPAGASAPPEPPGPAEDATPAVEFSSPLLEQAVRAELNIPQGGITAEDLKRVRRLAVVGQAVPGREQVYEYRLTGYLDGVSQLGLEGGDISDLSLLADMPNLRELYLCAQQVSDLSCLAGLPLESLYLCDNQIRDLSPLGECTTLQTLYLGCNPLEDLGPLASLTGLRRLNLDQWEAPYTVDSLRPIAGLPLEYLSLGNLIPADGSWEALEGLDGVRELWLSDPPEQAVARLPEMTGLQSLSVYNFWAAGELDAAALPQLSSLSLYGGPERLDWLRGLEGLSVLSLCGPGRFDLAPLAELGRLQYLYLFDCQIADYSPLARAPELKVVQTDAQSAAAVEAACPDRAFALNP